MTKGVMGRPKLDDPNVVRKTIRLSPKTVEKIEKRAKKEGITFSKVIRLAIDEYLK